LRGGVLNLHERKFSMALHIPQEVERLARLVASKTGKTPGDVLKEAIEARAEAAGIAPRPRRTPEEIEERINAIIKRVSALPILDHRSDDEIIGYNEFGVPE
jgi:antitoxin VapB